MHRYRVTLAQDARIYTEAMIQAEDDAAAVGQGAAAVRAGDLDPDWDGHYVGRGPELFLGFGDEKSLALIVDRLGEAPGDITEVYEGDLPPEPSDGQPEPPRMPVLATVDDPVAASGTLGGFAAFVKAVVLAQPGEVRDTFMREMARAVGWHPLCVLDETSVRDEVRRLQESEGGPFVQVTGDDLGQACTDVAQRIGLSEAFGAPVSEAAYFALAGTRERQEASTTSLAAGGLSTPESSTG